VKSPRHPCGSARIGATLAIVLLGCSTACSRESKAAAPAASKTAAAKADSSAAEPAAPPSPEPRPPSAAEFKSAAKSTLAAIDQRIAELRSKGTVASASAKAVLDESIESLAEARKALGMKVFELKADAPDATEKAMEELRSSIASLADAADRAVARFR